MIESIGPDVAFKNAIALVEVACDEVSVYLDNSEKTIEDEIIAYFRGTDNQFFIDDLRRFSVDLASEFVTVEQYSTYIGTVIGAFVAERTGFLDVVRYELEAITDDNDIRQRSLIYEQLYLSDFADPLEPYIPRPFDSVYLNEEFRHGSRAVLSATVAAIFDPELEANLRLAKLEIELDREAFMSSDIIDIGKMDDYFA
jgi:hypothetical protein